MIPVVIAVRCRSVRSLPPSLDDRFVVDVANNMIWRGMHRIDFRCFGGRVSSLFRAAADLVCCGGYLSNESITWNTYTGSRSNDPVQTFKTVLFRIRGLLMRLGVVVEPFHGQGYHVRFVDPEGV